jgi:hypothetical protein
MQCNNSFGTTKKKFDTLDQAIEACKLLNQQDKRIHKLVSYKCSKCCKFHIGSNGKLLKKNKNIYNGI